MRNTNPKKRHLRWREMSALLTLILSLLLLATPLSQMRTKAQTAKGKALGQLRTAPPVQRVAPPEQSASKAGDKAGDVLASSSEVQLLAARGNARQILAAAQATSIESAIGPAVSEIEPNNTFATAQPLNGNNVKVTGTIQPGTDVDWYSFYGNAGDRVYAASQTALSSGGSGLTGDGTLELFGLDGTTILEADNDDGSFAATAPSIAGLVLPTTGTYFIRMRHSSAAPASEIDPYDLYLRVQSGAPVAETEPNNNGQTPNPLPASGWVSGTIDPAGPPIDNDTYSVNLTAGDTVFISLDANPERDGTTFNPRLGFGLFDNFFLLADGSAAVSPNSEAFHMTVRDTGTYVIYVDTAVAGAGPTATYQMSVSVIPGVQRKCTTYTSTNVPQTIPVAAGIAVSTLNVPDSKIISNLKVNLNITHSALGELDVSLVAPDGNEVVLFDDPPAAAAGTTAPQIDVTIDDEAGLPLALFGINKPLYMQPESLGRLTWFKNQNSAGTWTLNVRDDAGVGSGTLNSWGITVCEDPRIGRPGAVLNQTIFSTDFEADNGAFTHSGTGDEWEYGLPTFAPITTCRSGTNCWKTDLDNTYNNAPTGQRIDQELVSPNIDLSTQGGRQITFEWGMKYNLEGSNWDNAFVEVREVGNPTNVKRVWEWAGPTMTRTVGSPAVTLNSAAGWGLWQGDISEFGGKIVQLVFHLDQDDSVALTGLAIDDVLVKASLLPPRAGFDVNAISDIGIWNPSNGVWTIRRSGTGTPITLPDWGRGSLGDILVPGDYNGNGSHDRAVYRPSEGNWYILFDEVASGGPPTGGQVVGWGALGDIPVPADYDGDGRTDVAVFRPSEGNWYIRNSATNTVTLRGWGAAGDKPAPGDYDGDGSADITVFRPSDGNWYTISSFSGFSKVTGWGMGSDRLVPADYDGDGKTDIAVWRPSEGNWYILKSTGGSLVRNWGNSGDIPVPGNYDADVKADIAVYRPSESNWYIIQSATNTVGLFNLGNAGGEQPVLAYYNPQ